MVQNTPLGASAPSQPNATTTDHAVELLIGTTVEDIERELILHTLGRCGGNRTHAAQILGMSVRTLRNKIKQYSAHGIEVPARH